MMSTEAFLTAQIIPFRCREHINVNRHRRNPLRTTSIRSARIPPVAKRAKDTTGVEDRLLSAVSKLRDALPEGSLHKYRASRPEDFAAAVAAAVELERTGLGFGSTIKRLSSLLLGTWRLVLTDSMAVERNAGSITGLGNLPGAKCINVEVRLEPDGKASTVERVKVFAGLMEGENTLEGKWKVDGDILEVTYAKAILMGKATVRADSKAVLRTSYCSRRVRIGRSAGGELYMFVKE